MTPEKPAIEEEPSPTDSVAWCGCHIVVRLGLRYRMCYICKFNHIWKHITGRRRMGGRRRMLTALATPANTAMWTVPVAVLYSTTLPSPRFPFLRGPFDQIGQAVSWILSLEKFFFLFCSGEPSRWKFCVTSKFLVFKKVFVPFWFWFFSFLLSFEKVVFPFSGFLGLW